MSDGQGGVERVHCTQEMVTVFIEHTKVIAKVLKKYYGLTPLGLSLSEYRILDAVRTAEEPVRSTDIARRLLLDRSVVSLFKDTMVEKGLVSFTPAEGDRRNYTVTLTPEGEGLALSARRVIETGRPTRTGASRRRVSRGAPFWWTRDGSEARPGRTSGGVVGVGRRGWGPQSVKELCGAGQKVRYSHRSKVAWPKSTLFSPKINLPYK